jgi:hypothetical protein
MISSRNKEFPCCRVEFEGEIGLDRGGLAKELFTIAIRDLVKQSKVLRPCSNGRIFWFTNCKSTAVNDHSMKHPRINCADDDIYTIKSPEYILGIMTRLAIYNGIFVNLPLPLSMYKVLLGKQVRDIYLFPLIMLI